MFIVSHDVYVHIMYYVIWTLYTLINRCFVGLHGGALYSIHIPITGKRIYAEDVFNMILVFVSLN